MNTELQICKGDLCGSIKTNVNVATALLIGIAIGAIGYAYYIHKNKGGLKAALRF